MINVPPGDVISTTSIESGFPELLPDAGTSTWPANNNAYFVGFHICEPIIVQRMFIWNVTPSGNIDLGIYTRDGTLLVSTGATALSGSNTTQGIAVTATTLAPGYYYMAASCSTTGYTPAIQNSGVILYNQGRTGSVFQMASAHPLPATATFAALSTLFIPFFGLSQRSFV